MSAGINNSLLIAGYHNFNTNSGFTLKITPRARQNCAPFAGCSCLGCRPPPSTGYQCYWKFPTCLNSCVVVVFWHSIALWPLIIFWPL
jgi:hypothetical protein